MRVLVVAHGHPRQYPAGGEWAAHTLFEALAATPGIEAHFAAPDLNAPPGSEDRVQPWPGKEQEWRLPLGAMDRFLLSQESPVALEAFGALLTRLAPDVVHFHHYMRSGVEAIALARRLLPRARILLTLHEFLAICHQAGQMVTADRHALCDRAGPERCHACFPERLPVDFALRRRFLLANFAKVDRFVSPSRFLRDRYIAWGLPAERFSVVENPVAPLPPVPPRPLPPGGRRAAFGYFGTIGPFKGLRVLVEAFERLVARGGWDDATLALHGLMGPVTPDFAEWFARAVKRHAPRLAWHGRYDRADLPRLMQGVDWVVVPSIWWENSPLVIQEARMAGRPLIVSDIGGMAEKVTPGEDGLVFAAGDAAALAEAMAFAVPRHDAMRGRDIAAANTARLAAILALYRGAAAEAEE
jgi:glycosyltransferase involved in cell wall biosynthesis